MSMQGIKKAAKVFEMMQQTRSELFQMGTRDTGNPDKVDILLAQMLEDGKEAMKHKFEKLTLK